MTLDGDFFEQHLQHRPVVVILRGLAPSTAVVLAKKAWDVGVSLVEVPLQSEQDLECLTAIRDAGDRRDRPVGAGTITSPELVDTAVSAGAEFTVAPGWDPDVAQRSSELGLPHLPGVASATEIQAVLRSGRHWMKAFPADALGERWFSGMLGPFPGTKFVATGGVDASNALQFLSAGATAVSFGSSFRDLPIGTLRALSRDTTATR